MTTQLEKESAEEVKQLCFRHKRFNESAVHKFAEQHSYAAALALMRECVEENEDRVERGLGKIGIAAAFKQKARLYTGDKKREVEADAWSKHVELVFQEQANGFDATPDQLVECLVEHHKQGNTTDEKYDRALKFLHSLYGTGISQNEQ